MPTISVLVLALQVGTAHAAWPDDVSLRSMASYNGESVDAEVVGEAYQQLVLELGTAVANKPVSSADTLGINGFAIEIDSTFSLIGAEGEGSDPSAWERAHEDNAPSPFLWAPRIHVRKGLPISMEVGATAGYVGLSRQTLLGGFWRWGLVEGYRKAPDVAVQVGYMGYIANDQLELGALDSSMTLGYSLPFGTVLGINETTFSPFLGVGNMRIHAAPRMTEEEQLSLGISPISGFKKSDYYIDTLQPWEFHAGFRLLKGSFQFRSAVSAAFGLFPTFDVGFGFVY